ncbi:adenosylcobinamide-GDP ribazoletransferase [Ectopseudomonas guguanensis]|jgi:adenosylcobinamide-GDP ribazoletransferase|uniref:adenosylcobinamide-GDP ribazoletransferase n=1 Tax=Ectopseudomonas guguanensis TaxID=1198456 RepID=UPI0012D61655|nr:MULTISPECIES: adenosylcobinamide-GDP ribazoletransferase [Pseudomonas]MPT19072.1 adenosylcobinamide-GDP ribazoletransferase [Pseudomonas sp.]WJH56423.1 adenosylcobinamide-GDP ribazoletransferase [Pseudomonas guguanensis]
MIAPRIALQFLTRLPVNLPGMPTPEQIGRSLLWYPAVGLLLGLLLWLAHLLLGQTPDVLQAAIILALWVGLSGGLHLDGLADMADAWVGGFGDRERTLAIMKDPRSGPIAVVVLVLLLLLKFAALLSLLQAGQGLYLLLLPWLGRSLLPLLLATTPYVRAGGLGQALADHLPRRHLPWVLGGHVAAMLLLGWGALIALATALALFVWLRRALLQRLGGTTGDTAGALVELAECAALLALALSL